MKLRALLLLIFLFSNLASSFQVFPQVETTSLIPNQIIISEEGESSNNPTWTNQLNTSLNFIGSKNETIILDHNKNFQLQPMPYPGSLDLGLINSSIDLLDFYNNFSKRLISGGVGDLYPSISAQDNSIHINSNESVFYNQLTLDYPINVSGSEWIRITSLHLMNWGNSMDGHVYDRLKFEFNTFTIYFVFSFSPDYYDVVTNSSETIYILSNNTTQLNLSIIDLIGDAGLDYPTTLNSIQFDAYNKEYYNYNHSYSEIKIIKTVKDPLIEINGEMTIYSELNYVNIKANQSTLISVSNNSQTSFFVNLTLNGVLNQGGSIYHIDDSIYYNSTIIVINIIDGYNYLIHIPEGMRVISNNTLISRNGIDYLAFTGKDEPLKSINVSYKLLKSADNPLDYVMVGNIIQNQTFNIFFNDLEIIKSEIWGNNFTEYVLGDLHIDRVSFQIPNHWMKGEVIMYLITADGYYLKIFQELKLSPAKLNIDSNILIHPAIDTVYEIKIVNLTDNKIHLPDKITSYYLNGTVRAIDDNHGIIFNHFDFSNRNLTLLINITSQGFISLKYKLNFEFLEFNPSFEVSTKRLSEIDIEFYVIIPNSVNWTVPLQIFIHGENTSFTQIFMANWILINIRNVSWNASDILSFNITLDIGDSIKRLSKLIEVEIWDGPLNTSPFSLAQFVYGSLASSVIILITRRMIKIRNGRNQISF
jgi:hypothetical protein